MSETTLMTPTDLVGKCLKDWPVWGWEAWTGADPNARDAVPRYYLANASFYRNPSFELIKVPSAELGYLVRGKPLLSRDECLAHRPEVDDCVVLEPAVLSFTGGLRTVTICEPRDASGSLYLNHPVLERLMGSLPHSVCYFGGSPDYLDIFVPDDMAPGLYQVGGLKVEVDDRHYFFPYSAGEFTDKPVRPLSEVAPTFRIGDIPKYGSTEPLQRARHRTPKRAFDPADVIDVPVRVKDPIKLSFASAGDFLDKSHMQWRVQDFLPATGVAMIYGASQSGKTLLGIDLAGAVLNGREWLGQATEKAPVVYAALEGPEGFRDRVKAYAKHHGKNALADLKVLNKTFSLTDRDHLDVLIRQLQAIGYRDGIFIIDTLSVVAHGDLNQNSFGSEVYRACKRIVDAVGGLVLLVHHTGKDEDKGAKGASSITQHIDTILKVEDRRGMRVVKIEKQRDGDTSQKLRFAVKPVAIGQDDRGKTVTSVIAVEDHYGKVVLRGHNQDALDILDDLVETVGRTPDELQLRDKVGLSVGTRLITKEEWKNAFLDAARTTTDKQKEARRKAFDRAFTALGDLGFYGFHGDFIYLKK